jgi:hypothetical protein
MGKAHLGDLPSQAEKARYDIILDLVTQIQDLKAKSQKAKGPRLASILDRSKLLQSILDTIVDRSAD